MSKPCAIAVSRVTRSDTLDQADQQPHAVRAVGESPERDGQQCDRDRRREPLHQADLKVRQGEVRLGELLQRAEHGACPGRVRDRDTEQQQ